MVSPPEQPDNINCDTCGKPNPLNAAVCQYCGAHLHPVAAPGEPEPISPLPPVEDGLDALRQAIDEKAISNSPTSPLSEPEPDFMFGGASDGEDVPPPPDDELSLADEGEAILPGNEPSIDEALGWLSEGEQATQPAGGPPSPPSQPLPADIPAWLSEFDESDEGEQPEQPKGVPADEPPGWLAELQESSAEEGQPVAAPPEADEEYVEPPDWLQELESAPGEPQEEVGPPVPAPLIPTGKPRWLRPTDELREELAPPEEGEEPAARVEPSAPAGEAEVPAWLAELGEPGQEAPATEAEPELPPPAQEAIPDWMDTFSFEDRLALPTEAAAMPDLEGEDLLGLSGDLIAPPTGEQEEDAEAAVEQAAVLEMGELPEWLHGLRDEEEAPQRGEETGTPDEGLLEQIQGLRFEAIAGETPHREEAGPETIGALKDVTGVIQPELIFEGSSLSASEPVEALVITEEQVAQVELIKKLLAREAAGIVLAERQRTGLPVLRWLVALALILAIGAPLLPLVQALSPLQPGGGTPGVGAAYDALDSLTTRQATVVVAFEYEPDAAAELQPLAEAILEHLAGMEGVTVYAVSTWPTGPAMAEAALRQPTIQPRLAATGGTWVNLGYLAGRANGVNNLAIGPPPGVPSALASDFLGQPTGIGSTRLIGEPFDMLIVLAARPEDLRMWIEQASQPTGLPVVAGLSVRAAPLAEPYWQSGQIVAALSGVNDALAYRVRAGQEVVSPLLGRWTAQAAGSVAAASLIVLGVLVYSLWPARTQQEQSR